MATDESKQDTDFHYHYIVGITSFGIECGRKGTPGVYTRVDQYIDWILSHMKP